MKLQIIDNTAPPKVFLTFKEIPALQIFKEVSKDGIEFTTYLMKIFTYQEGLPKDKNLALNLTTGQFFEVRPDGFVKCYDGVLSVMEVK